MLHPKITRDQGRARHARQVVRQGRGETGGGAVRSARRASAQERDARAPGARGPAGPRVGRGGRRRGMGGRQNRPRVLRHRAGPPRARRVGRGGRGGGVDRAGRRRGGRWASGRRSADIRCAARQLGLGGAYLRAGRRCHPGPVAGLQGAACPGRGTAPGSSGVGALVGHPVAAAPHLRAGAVLGEDVNRARFDAALRRDPLDLEVHIDWVSQLQPRWGGEPGRRWRSPGRRSGGLRRGIRSAA